MHLVGNLISCDVVLMKRMNHHASYTYVYTDPNEGNQTELHIELEQESKHIRIFCSCICCMGFDHVYSIILSISFILNGSALQRGF